MFDITEAGSLYEKILDGVILRQKVISNNIANQDTPGYRAKRVRFEEALADAAAGGDRRGRQIEFSVYEPAGGDEKINGNNVSLEQEWMLLEKNRLIHQVFTKALGGTFKKLTSAIVGR